MENIEKTFKYSSSSIPPKSISKEFIASDDEIEDVLKFEKKLIDVVNRFSDESFIRKNIKIAEEELVKKVTFYKRKRIRYYSKVISEGQNQLLELRILKRLITQPYISKKEDYKYLIYYILKYAKNKKIINVYIKSAKNLNITNSFLNCFDENGVLLDDCLIIMEMILTSFKNLTDISDKTSFSLSDYKSLFMTKRQLKLLEEQKLKLKETPEESINIVKYYKEMATQDDETVSYSRYVDSFGNLYESAIKTDLDTVLEDIKNTINPSKEKLEDYKKQYYDLYVRKEIRNLTTIKASKKEQLIILNILNDHRLFEKARALLLSDEYKALTSTEEKKNFLLEEFIEEEQLSISDDINNNLFLFPYDGFLQEQMDTVCDKTNISREALVKAFQTKFKALDNNNILDMQKNFKKTVHRILDKSNNAFTICDGMIAYRFGARVTKVCYAIVPMPDSNKKMLQEKYHLNDNFRVLIILGFGHVKTEPEFDMYERIKRTTKENERYYLNIIKLFVEPFTEETFKQACEYIEHGAKEIETTLEYKYLGDEDTPAVKKRQ